MFQDVYEDDDDNEYAFCTHVCREAKINSSHITFDRQQFNSDRMTHMIE